MTRLPADVISSALVKFSHLATGSMSKTAHHVTCLQACRRDSMGTALHNTRLVHTVVCEQCLMLPYLWALWGKSALQQ